MSTGSNLDTAPPIPLTASLPVFVLKYPQGHGQLFRPFWDLVSLSACRSQQKTSALNASLQMQHHFKLNWRLSLLHGGLGVKSWRAPRNAETIADLYLDTLYQITRAMPLQPFLLMSTILSKFRLNWKSLNSSHSSSAVIKCALFSPYSFSLC